tara:strand:+ start:284 stop:514 length:231 start_codon:yes stop_codon:yes gene_type:complete
MIDQLRPWQRLNFFPLLHQQGSFLPIFWPVVIVPFLEATALAITVSGSDVFKFKFLLGLLLSTWLFLWAVCTAGAT